VLSNATTAIPYSAIRIRFNMETSSLEQRETGCG
jgi:hypothetical protein